MSKAPDAAPTAYTIPINVTDGSRYLLVIETAEYITERRGHEIAQQLSDWLASRDLVYIFNVAPGTQVKLVKVPVE